MGFFRVDGPYYKFGVMIADIVVMSIVWFVCSLPLVTIGASTTAIYYNMTKRVSGREGYQLKDFFSSFKKNFVQATLVWLTVLALTAIILFNLNNAQIMGRMASVIVPIQLALLFGITAVGLYSFPLLSRFEAQYFGLLKSAFFMASRHFLTTITVMLLFIASLWLVYAMPVFIIFVPASFFLLSSKMFVLIFRKHRPELDRDEDEAEVL